MLDLKAIIGFFFFIIGVLLVIYQWFSGSADMNDINLLAGLFYIVFGSALLLFWKFSGTKKEA